MSESVIADFVGKFSSETSTRSKPATGRVILSQKRLVLAVDSDDKMTIPLSSIFDVAVGHVPPDLEEFFTSSVTVAFERGGDHYVAAVESDNEKIDKFSTVLFKAILNGTDVTVKHPARVGGRVTDAEYVPAKLGVESGVVRFNRAEDRVEIPLETVTGFDRGSREIAGADRSVLLFRHMENGQATMTVVATDSARKLSILSRYLRLEYAELIEDLQEIDLASEEKELLVALYSGAGEEGMSLANVVDAEASQVTLLLNRMEEKGLVVDADGTTKLTPKGRVVVNNHLEDVND